MTKREKIAKLARDEVKNNSLYLWGGQGEEVMKTTPETIKKMETSSANAGRVLKCLANKMTVETNMNKARFFDCSGLVVEILRKLSVIDEKSDYTAQGIYKNLCVPVLLADLKEGDLCFINTGGKISHVGVYVGEREVVESASRDLGVVKRGMSKNSWNIYGRVKLNEK